MNYNVKIELCKILKCSIIAIFYMNTRFYSDLLKRKVDISRYYRLVNGLGPSLNDRKSRFDKSDIIEQSLEVYSDGTLKWVDQEGYDVFDTEHQLKIEVKYEDHGLFTLKGNRKSCIQYKIKNTLKELTTAELSNPADYYLFLELNGMALISYEEMKDYLVITKARDGIACKIPFDKLNLFSERDKNIEISEIILNYKDEKHKLQKQLLNMI